MAVKSKNNIAISYKYAFFGLLLVVIAIIVYQFLDGRSINVYRDKEMSLKERGINSENVTIRAVEAESSWQYNDIAYEVKKIYLTPDIADIGDWRDNFNIGTENQFVVVELEVRDKRTSGGKRNVDTTSFLRVRVGNIENGPKNTDYLYLNPQEDGKIFRVFVVDKETKEITLLSGITSRPRVTKVDFFSGDLEVMQGVFLHKSGFSPEYSE